MASFPLFAGFVLLTFSASFRLSEGGCFQTGAIPMCQAGATSGRTIFIDTNRTIADGEECRCQVTRSADGSVEIAYIPGTQNPPDSINCDMTVKIDQNGSPIHEVDCLAPTTVTREVLASPPIEMVLGGPGMLNACIFMTTSTEGQTSDTLTVTCTENTPATTTLQPPTTTTQQPPPTTTQQPGPTTTQQPGPTTTQQPGPTTTQQPGPTTTQQPGPTTTQQPGPTTTQQPGQTTTQQPGPTTTQQPGQTTTQQPGPTTTQQPGPTTTPQMGTTQPIVGGTTSAFDSFPVAEVAGGVAGGILLMILLVICITCCTSRSKERDVDEESLKSHASQSPMPEMQENKEGYAFDNLLYHASQEEGGKDGKSLTPTVSEGSTHDEAAVKGLEELYASVNKNITLSTDIM